jgi:hypothetical protein
MTHVSNEQMMEVQGWLCERQDDGLTFWVGPMSKVRIRRLNYIHDLNLVHEIEAGLPEMERTHYLNLLANEVVENDDDNMDVGFDGLSYIGSFMVVCATAQQKCDALFPILLERSKR